MRLTAPQPKAPTRELLEFFDAQHVEKLGARAVIQFGKDAKLLASLWRSHGTDMTKLLIGDFFGMNDPWIVARGYSVGVFITQAAGLLARRQLTRQRAELLDWWEECKRLHAGACGSRYRHGVRSELEAAKRRA